jgi:hypothetical protein
VLRGLPKEDALTGTGSEVIRSIGRGVRVVVAPEDPEVGIGGSGAKKGRVGEGAEIALVGRRLRRYVTA